MTARIHMVPQIVHERSVGALAFSPDSRSLASSDGTTIKLWDSVTGLLVQTIPLQSGREWREPWLCFSPDGQRLLTGGKAELAGNEIQLWDPRSGTLIWSYAGRDADVVAAFFPNGGLILSVACDGTLRTRNTETGASSEIGRLADGKATAIALTDDIAVTGHESGSLSLWDLRKCALIRSLPFASRKVLALVISPDGRTVAASATYIWTDRPLGAWDIASGKRLAGWALPDEASVSAGRAWEQRTLILSSVRPDPVKALAFARGGRSLFACTARGLLARFEDGILVGQQERSITAPDGSRRVSGRWPEDAAAAFSPDLSLGVTGHFGPLSLWDVATNRQLRTLGVPVDKIHRVAVSSDGDRALFTGDDSPTAWDLTDVHMIRRLAGATSPAVLMPDGRCALTATKRGCALWNIHTGMMEQAYRAEEPQALAVSFDGARGCRAWREAINPEAAASASWNEWDDDLVAFDEATKSVMKGIVFDITTGADIQTFCLDNGSVSRGGFLPDGRVYWQNIGWPFVLCDSKTGDVQRISVHVDEIMPDGVHGLVTGRGPEAIRLVNLTTGDVVRTFHEATSAVDRVSYHVSAVAPDGRVALTVSDEGAVALWNIATGTLRRQFPGQASRYLPAAITADARRFVVANNDGTARMFDVESGGSLTFMVSGDDWLVYTEDGYFDASRRGGALAAAVQDGRAFSIDQLAVRTNRPDIVLQRIGGDRDLIAHFRARFDVRLKRVGLDETSLDAALERAPFARILEAKVNGEHVDLTFELEEPSGGTLYRYSIFVNDVPLFGALGREIDGSRVRRQERIELSVGRNKIEVCALNRDGIESQRALHVVSYEGDVSRDLYYLGFGVSSYRDNRLNLAYAHKDALDLEATLKRAAHPRFRQAHTKTYIDRDVTVDNIRAAKAFLTRTRVDDTVVLFVAGHGTYTRDLVADYHYVTHDVNVSDVRGTAAPFGLLEELLQGIPARRKLFLMDTCESGDRDDAEEEALATAAASQGLKSRSVRAFFREARRDLTMPMQPAPRPFLLNRERYIYNDLTRRTGAIVFSSSGGAESSFEHDDWQNGAFTAEIIAALTTDVADTDKDGLVSTDELRAYVSAAVVRRTGGLQHPTVDRDNIEIRFGLPRVTSSHE